MYVHTYIHTYIHNREVSALMKRAKQSKTVVVHALLKASGDMNLAGEHVCVYLCACVRMLAKSLRGFLIGKLSPRTEQTSMYIHAQMQR
jgi:hypothetical protein